MANLTPNATLFLVTPGDSIGSGNPHTDLDASTSSYVIDVGGPVLIATVGMSDPGATALQLVECTLTCDGSGSLAPLGPTAGAPAVRSNVRTNVTPYAGPAYTVKNWGIFGVGNALGSFSPMVGVADSFNGDWSASARLTKTEADGLTCSLYNPSGWSFASPLGWTWNNLVVTTVILSPPTVTVTGPTGTIGGNSPTIFWTNTATTQRAYEMRIYTSAVYGSGGFDPNSAAYPAAFATSVAQAPPGSGPTTGTWNNKFAKVTTSLPQGTYRAYVRAAADLSVMPGQYQHMSDWAFSTFTIIDVPPAVAGPTIPAGILTALPRRSRLYASHVATSQAILFSPDASSAYQLNVITGSVRYDATSKIRATASLEVSDVDLVPSSNVPFQPSDFLHPFGSYIHLARGIDQDLVGLGVFRIDEVRVSRSGQPKTARITASDFGGHLDDARFTWSLTRQSWTTNPPTQPLVTAVAAAIVAEAGLSFRLGGSSAAVVAANYVNQQTSSRLDALGQLADQLGWVTYLADDGVVYFGPSPSLTPAAASFVEGDTATLATDVDYVLTRKDTYDLAVAYDQTGTYIAGAYDSNPQSPLRRSNATITSPVTGAGPFSPGGKAKFYSSPIIGSLAVAQATAKTVLTGAARLLDPIQISAIPDPGLRPGMGVDLLLFEENAPTRMQVLQVTIPLDPPAAMQVTVTGQATFVSASN